METFFSTSKFYNRGHLVVVDDDEEQWKLLFVRVTRINSPARAHYRPLCEIGFLGTQCIDAQCVLLGFNISRESYPCIYLAMISFSFNHVELKCLDRGVELSLYTICAPS